MQPSCVSLKVIKSAKTGLLQLRMKKKIVWINLLMSLTVLFAMLFQTLHSYEHAHKQITQKHCEHVNVDGQKQITHSHSVEHDCHICHFAFSNFIPNSFQTPSFLKVSFETSYIHFYTKAAATFFKGSLFALRAPPTLL